MTERGDLSQAEACLFCRLAAGDLRAEIVSEDAKVMAILDRAPIRPGHVLILPRQHVTYFEDLSSDLMAATALLAQNIAAAQKRIYGVERVAFLFTGGDIPHVHAHLVPMVEKTDITSTQFIEERGLTFRPAPEASIAELERVAANLKGALRG